MKALLAMRGPGASVAVAFAGGFLAGATLLAVWLVVEVGRMARELLR